MSLSGRCSDLVSFSDTLILTPSLAGHPLMLIFCSAVVLEARNNGLLALCSMQVTTVHVKLY